MFTNLILYKLKVYIYIYIRVYTCISVDSYVCLFLLRISKKYAVRPTLNCRAKAFVDKCTFGTSKKKINYLGNDQEHQNDTHTHTKLAGYPFRQVDGK